MSLDVEPRTIKTFLPPLADVKLYFISDVKFVVCADIYQVFEVFLTQLPMIV